MKYISLIILLAAIFTSSAIAQEKENKNYVENDLISLNGKDGITFQTQAGDFLFKPYVLIQNLSFRPSTS